MGLNMVTMPLSTTQAASKLREQQRRLDDAQKAVQAVNFFEQFRENLAIQVVFAPPEGSRSSLDSHSGRQTAMAFILAEIPEDVIARARAKAQKAMEEAMEEAVQ